MQLLGYAHGVTVIIPSDISPDMFGTRSCTILSGFLKSLKSTNLKVSYHGRGVDGSLAYCIVNHIGYNYNTHTMLLGIYGFTAINP